MINNAQNKAVNPDQPTNVVAVSSIRNSYFFPGGGVWKPMSVEATNREQAEEIHRAKRQPVSPVEIHNDTEQPIAAEEKVETATNNE